MKSKSKKSSRVLAEWMRVLERNMPSQISDSAEWQSAISLAAKTGCDREKERLAEIGNQMWAVLETADTIADAGGYGGEWREMCGSRSAGAAVAASEAAEHTESEIDRDAHFATETAALEASFYVSYGRQKARVLSASEAASAVCSIADEPEKWEVIAAPAMTRSIIDA